MVDRIRHVIPVVLAVLGHATVAAAEQPWEVGISTNTRTRAQALFEEGNQLFAREAHAPALVRYEEAIALWDHPLIRLNKAITELRLDRVLQAADDLDAALRYGAAPFDDGEYRKALAHRDAVARRVGRVEASCREPGAQVLLDGEVWFACPGRGARRVLAGTHVVVGHKDGYLPISRQQTVAAGTTAVETLAFVRIDETIVYQTPRWIPWTIAGGGAALAVGGVVLAVAAARQMDRFDAAFAKRCPSGCAADLSDVPDLRRTKERAETKSALAVTGLIAGGAALVTGAVWAVWFDRPRRVVPVLEVHPTTRGAEARVSWHF